MPYKRKDSPYWWLSYRDASGKKVNESSATTSYAEAKALEDTRRVEARTAQKWGIDPERTFDEVMLVYVEAQRDKASAERIIFGLRQMHPVFTGMKMRQITGRHIRGYIQTRQDGGISTETIRRELGIFSAACNWCARELEWTVPNPVMGRLPATGDGRVRWITRAEAAALLRAAKQQPKAPHLADFVWLGLQTGMRRGELLGLEWNRVDLQRALLYLDTTHQKNRRRSSIPLNREAKAALLNRARWRATHCPASPWVFAHEDGSRIQSVKRSFRTACRTAGITDFRIHDLRHTSAAWLVQAGTPLAEVSELLRHADIRMTMRYAHLAPENIRSAVDRLATGDYDLTTLSEGAENGVVSS